MKDFHPFVRGAIYDALDYGKPVRFFGDADELRANFDRLGYLCRAEVYEDVAVVTVVRDNQAETVDLDEALFIVDRSSAEAYAFACRDAGDRTVIICV